jgi:hypothetical protein
LRSNQLTDKGVTVSEAGTSRGKASLSPSMHAGLLERKTAKKETANQVSFYLFWQHRLADLAVVVKTVK